MSTKVLEEIREELQEIKLLYKELVDKLIPVEDATQKEKSAIEEKRRSSRRERTNANFRLK